MKFINSTSLLYTLVLCFCLLLGAFGFTEDFQRCYSYEFFNSHFNISRENILESLKTSIAAGGLSRTNKHKIKDAEKEVRVLKMLQNVSEELSQMPQRLEYVDSTNSLLILYCNESNTLYVGGRHVEPALSKQGFFDIIVAVLHRIAIFSGYPERIPRRFKNDADHLQKVLRDSRFQTSKIILTGFSLGGAEALIIKEKLIQDMREDVGNRTIKAIVWNAGGFSFSNFYKRKFGKHHEMTIEEKLALESKDIIVFQVEGDLISDFWKKPGVEFRIPLQRNHKSRHGSSNFVHFFSEECPSIW